MTWLDQRDFLDQVVVCSVALADEGASPAEVGRVASDQLERTLAGKGRPTPDIWLDEFFRMRERVRERLETAAHEAARSSEFSDLELFDAGWRHWLNVGERLTADALDLEARGYCYCSAAPVSSAREM